MHVHSCRACGPTCTYTLTGPVDPRGCTWSQGWEGAQQAANGTPCYKGACGTLTPPPGRGDQEGVPQGWEGVQQIAKCMHATEGLVVSPPGGGGRGPAGWVPHGMHATKELVAPPQEGVGGGPARCAPHAIWHACCVHTLVTNGWSALDTCGHLCILGSRAAKHCPGHLVNPIECH